ncbi:MAG TPA: SpoIID/LytB domain-containing protein [Blastocatellia bacterium]|nr:SpoIID/LytB domain-containing protein [Blastocatellia bacterium]
MIDYGKEPLIDVGLITGARSVRLTLGGRFEASSGERLESGDYIAEAAGNRISLQGASQFEGPVVLSPSDFKTARFTVHDVTIGIDFHWERKESQSFQGSLKLSPSDGLITVINRLPVESYIVSVISSEMSPLCPGEALRAHAVISRGWLLAQLEKAKRAQAAGAKESGKSDSIERGGELIRWYDRENHDEFDVCADDHCQRYQGISKAFSEAAFEAVHDTRGRVLTWRDEICDTRYSKSCGGMTEVYRAAWEDKDVPYLRAVYDGAGEPSGFSLPLTVEANAERWITDTPDAYCNAPSGELIERILPGFDQETQDFYRWKVTYTQQELQDLLRARVGLELGRIKEVEAAERGESGRILRLKITGETRSVVIGKELEIRRALSRSHLYSSAFVVRKGGGEYPSEFQLAGAGWGHGVGLCQIGAAVMADLGRSHGEILAHYFRGATLSKIY